MIEVNNAIKKYGAITAVDGVNLTINAGALFGLIGHNGAGKSTLFKMMLGLIPITSGTIVIEGKSVAGDDFRAVRQRLGYLPENISLYDNLTGMETLQFFARIKSADPKECAQLLETVGLMHAATRRVKGYSKGMRQRLGFAQALLGNPKLLLLDEPTNGLDPEAIRKFYQVLNQKKAEGTTIIITSHILAEIQERVDKLAIMRNGSIQAEGTLNELRQSMDLPMSFIVHLAKGGLSQLTNQLTAITECTIKETAPDVVSVHCPRALKMVVMTTLMQMPNLILDLQLHESSLEELFLGYSELGRNHADL